ncbi:peptidase family C69-domain-containing protein [Ochromonadaceae sp. CCMP2298]|nr:peptidase family C69-domain-containing protein [Ochromonadaceae sp. CCMP2298]
MFSDNIFKVAERAGLYKPSDGLLDFLPTFGPMRAHSEYSTRRVWRIFSLVAPSLDLPGHTDYYGNDYPFSVKTEKLLTALDLMDLQRDHYEGTEFDLTQGLAAGPYGDPARWDISPPANMSMKEILSGGFERSISMFRTSYSFVALARPVPDKLALLWFGTYNPASCSYAPFYVAADHVPAAYTRGSLFQYDPSSAFWNFLAAGNYAGRFYKHAMVEVRLLQDQLHTDMLKALGTLERSLLPSLTDPYETSSYEGQAMVDRLTDFTNFHGNMVVNEWRNLLPRLITKYHDGYIATALQAPTIVMQKIFYPLWWLKAVGYFEENKGNFGPGVILFGPGPAAEGGLGGDGGFTAALLSAALLSSLLTMLLTVCYMQNRYKAQTQGYTTIECA